MSDECSAHKNILFMLFTTLMIAFVAFLKPVRMLSLHEHTAKRNFYPRNLHLSIPVKHSATEYQTVLVDTELTYDDASSYCRAQEGAIIHVIDSWKDIELLENLKTLGKYFIIQI